MSETRCIYCNRSESDGIIINKSDIIPESLTNAKLTCSNVCSEDHNAEFGNTFESDVINELSVLRNKLNIKNKGNKFPPYPCKLEIGGKVFIKNKLHSDSDPIGRSTLKSDDETTLFKPICDSEDNIDIYEDIYDLKTLTINKIITINLSIFKSESMFRMVAKIAYEWFCKINDIMHMNTSFSDVINFIITGQSDKNIVTPITNKTFIDQISSLIGKGSHLLTYYTTSDNELKAIVSIFGVSFYKVNLTDNLINLDNTYKIVSQEFDLSKTHKPITYKSINDLENIYWDNFIFINSVNFFIPYCVSPDMDTSYSNKILLTHLVYKYLSTQNNNDYNDTDFFNSLKPRLEYLLSTIFINKPELKRFSKEYGGSNFTNINWDNPDSNFWLRFYILYLIGKSDSISINEDSLYEILYNKLPLDSNNNILISNELSQEWKSIITSDCNHLEVILKGFEKINNWI